MFSIIRGYFTLRACSAATPLPYLLPGCAITLILLSQANIVVDRSGCARLTEYGLAPINTDPRFTVVMTPGAAGTSWWLAPEIITPTRKGAAMPVMESKPADIFAFAMLAAEVFTGKVPFEEQIDEAVALRISQGERPAIPEYARDVGLTKEMWKILEGCWHRTPKKRLVVGEVVKRWQRSITKDDVFIPPCVRIILTIVTSCWFHTQLSMVDLGSCNSRKNRERVLVDVGRGPRPLNLNFERKMKPFDSGLCLRRHNPGRNPNPVG